MPSKEQVARWTKEEQRRNREREEEAAKNERMIAKRKRELDELEANLKVDPPPELSPSELKERELAERVAALEGEKRLAHALPGDRPPLESTKERRLKEDLRLRLIDRENAAQSERNREHERRASKQIKQLEGRIAEAESKRDAEQQRHRRTVAELGAALSEASDKLSRLCQPIAQDETTDDRLRALELTL